jgi:hypothetical protein
VNEAVRALLLDALGRRLAEVQGRPGAGPGVQPPVEPPADPEEALRVLMVRLLPQAEAASDGRSDADLVSGVRALHGAARSDDLRFLDAWNRVYESGQGDRAFLDDYAVLLGWHVRRLGS